MEHIHSKNPEMTVVDRAFLERLRDENDAELSALHASMEPLFEARHELFHLKQSPFTGDDEASLYSEPSYNGTFIMGDLGLRGGGALEFHNEAEQYDPSQNDSSELLEVKRAYRQAILGSAQEAGFVTRMPSEASNEFDRHLEMLDSELSPIEEQVDVIVAGAAGLSNVMRMRDAVRNIESGAVSTKTIVLSGCERSIGDAERQRVEAFGFRSGETEFEALIAAAEDVAGTVFSESLQQYEVRYGNDLLATSREGYAEIGGQEVRIVAVSAPYDTERLVNGRPANRANTEETFHAVAPYLGDRSVLVESHDAWVQYQKLVAQQVFSVSDGKRVYATGSRNATRVTVSEDGEQDLLSGQAVVDEMAKVYGMLAQTRIQIENKIAKL